MRLGGPVFVKTQDPVELAKAHRKAGYRAAYCPGGISIEETEKISAYREAFKQEDVVIAEVGAWCNPLDPRSDIAEKNIQYVIERLALADELGALCCVNVIGSYSTDFWYAPHVKNFSQDAFDASVVIARRVIDTVKPKSAKLTFEIMPYVFLDGPQNYLSFIKAVDRKEAGVHLDPVNCINSPRSYFNYGEIFEESFRILAPYIVSCHVKDIMIRQDPPNTQLVEVRPGLGIVDYKLLLKYAASLPNDVPLMMEHLDTEEEYKAGRDYILKVAEELNLTL